jgi:hypothetical protein
MNDVYGKCNFAGASLVGRSSKHSPGAELMIKALNKTQNRDKCNGRQQ